MSGLVPDKIPFDPLQTNQQHVHYYDSNMTMPRSNKRELVGVCTPGLGQPTFFEG